MASSEWATLARRNFLRAGAGAVVAGAGTLIVSGSPGLLGATAAGDFEWRNKQSSIAYRRLGRTGLIISEVVSGSDPIKLDNYAHCPGWSSGHPGSAAEHLSGCG